MYLDLLYIFVVFVMCDIQHKIKLNISTVLNFFDTFIKRRILNGILNETSL